MHPSERAVGQFPLSISTSLALEGALGIHPDRPVSSKTLKDFGGHMANVKTLFRNYYEAIGKDNIVGITPKELIESFREEIDMYRSIVSSQSGKSLETFLYCPDYKGLSFRFPKAILRTDRTPNQILYSKTMTMVLGDIIKNEKDLIHLYPLKITDKQPAKTLILTHFAYDLTSKVEGQLYLLESHTGAIKDKSKWYTKYYNGKDYATIPFNEAFLPIFGDSQTFSPLGGAYRRTIVELSQKYNWSFATSKDKVMYGLDTLRDRYMADTIKEFLKHWS